MRESSDELPHIVDLTDSVDMEAPAATRNKDLVEVQYYSHLYYLSVGRSRFNRGSRELIPLLAQASCTADGAERLRPLPYLVKGTLGHRYFYSTMKIAPST